MSANWKPSEDEIKTLERLALSFDTFRLFRSTMPISYAQAFCEVAKKPGEATVTEIAKALGIDQPSMSRNLLELGIRRRAGDEGLGLIEWVNDINDLRGKFYRPTDKGIQIVKNLTRLMKT
jgi:DNA-binding MarR family transcriptional regulator